MDYLDLCIRARLVYADIDLIDKDLRLEYRTGEHTMILVKQSLITIKNLTDLLDENRLLNREFPLIAEARSALKRDFEFCAYIRSRYAGHVDKRVISKAIMWKPELRWAIYENHASASNFINLCILETTINTFVNPDGTHKVFEGDTDLNYPPDMERFLNFLARVLIGGKEIAQQIIDASLSKLKPPPPPGSLEAMELYKLSGLTDFHFFPGAR